MFLVIEMNSLEVYKVLSRMLNKIKSVDRNMAVCYLNKGDIIDKISKK